MHPTTCVGLDEESNKADNSQYRAMIGSLLYLTASRPDILLSVGLCSKFQQDPREVQLTAVERIFRYLIRTFNLGLYFKYNKEFRLISYCDADYAGNKIERRGTSGSFHIIGGNLVTWISKKRINSVIHCRSKIHISSKLLHSTDMGKESIGRLQYI